MKVSAGIALTAAAKLSGASGLFASSAKPTSGDEKIEMEYRSLAGLRLSAIGLGYLPMVGYYGGSYDKNKMIALIRQAYERGVTFFDTAEILRSLHQRRLGR